MDKPIKEELSANIAEIYSDDDPKVSRWLAKAEALKEKALRLRRERQEREARQAAGLQAQVDALQLHDANGA